MTSYDTSQTVMVLAQKLFLFFQTTSNESQVAKHTDNILLHRRTDGKQTNKSLQSMTL